MHGPRKLQYFDPNYWAKNHPVVTSTDSTKQYVSAAVKNPSVPIVPPLPIYPYVAPNPVVPTYPVPPIYPTTPPSDTTTLP